MSQDFINACRLTDRGFITISGPDRVSFLQGLVSNDVEETQNGKAIWAAILTPQGKFLHDFFVLEREDHLLIECDKSELMALGQLLRKHQLRADVKLGIDNKAESVLFFEKAEFLDQLKIEAGAVGQCEYGLAYVDPRHHELGIRLVSQSNNIFSLPEVNENLKILDDYNTKRVKFCIPDGVNDIPKNKGLLLEYGFDELNGISWDKGCYMGQELTARTKYRALIKKRLLKIVANKGQWEAQPKPEDDIIWNSQVVGQVRTVAFDAALAFIDIRKLGDFEEIVQKSKEGLVTVEVNGEEAALAFPDWMG